MRVLSFLILILLYGCNAPSSQDILEQPSAQEVNEKPTKPRTKKFTPLEMSNQRRLAIFNNISSLKKSPDDPNAFGWWNQMTAAAGREDILQDLGEDNDGGGSPYICEADTPGDAIDQIAALTSEHSLIIINEDHARPEHRVFIHNLALRLRREGFTHYAAETFSETAASHTGYPVTDDGWYTTDPMMGRLVADIKSAGYKLIAYEQRMDQGRGDQGDDVGESIAKREAAQAKNLQDALLRDLPDTKLLVHVGHGHVAEKQNGPHKWLAQRLKEATGIDPLTISLTRCASAGTDIVLSTRGVNANGLIANYNTDYLIGMPVTGFRDGRPEYRYRIGDIATNIPKALIASNEPLLIEARPPSAPANQEPVERLYLEPGESLPLMLPVGTWSVEAFNIDGPVAGPIIIVVND